MKQRQIRLLHGLKTEHSADVLIAGLSILPGQQTAPGKNTPLHILPSNIRVSMEKHIWKILMQSNHRAHAESVKWTGSLPEEFILFQNQLFLTSDVRMVRSSQPQMTVDGRCSAPISRKMRCPMSNSTSFFQPHARRSLTLTRQKNSASS